jgi:hypothetical protein
MHDYRYRLTLAYRFAPSGQVQEELVQKIHGYFSRKCFLSAIDNLIVGTKVIK